MTFENLDESIYLLIFRLIVSPVSILGNSVILYIALRFKKFRSTIYNCLMGLLAFGSLLVGIGILTRAFYSLYNLSHKNEFNRIECILVGLPIIFGIPFCQIILLFMAIDRLYAVSRPTDYYYSKSFNRVYIATICAFISGSMVAFLILWEVDPTPTRQCNTGAAANRNFVRALFLYGILVTVAIFSVYMVALIFLIKRSQTTDHSITLSIERQRKIFVTISFILLFYFIFWCLPLLTSIIVEFTSNDPILLGHMSIIISTCSDLFSSVAIFVYLAKHPEMREYIVKEINTCTKCLITNQTNNSKVIHKNIEN